MKTLALIALAAAATGCAAKPMDNVAFMDACDACKARGYKCTPMYSGWEWALQRVAVRCDLEPDQGKANIQAMLQIAVPLDARTEKGKRK